MFSTIRILTLALLLLSPTLGVASPLPADPAQAYATCGAYYAMVIGSHHGVPEKTIRLLMHRADAATRALTGVLGDISAAIEHTTVAHERLAFVVDGTYESLQALTTQYDAACTALLMPVSVPASTLGQANPLPQDRTQAYTTCAAYYETLFDSLVWFVSHPNNILRRRRQGMAIDALRVLLQDDTTVIKRRILAAQDRLALELQDTTESYEALARQYEEPCTALLRAPRPERDWNAILFGKEPGR